MPRVFWLQEWWLQLFQHLQGSVILHRLTLVSSLLALFKGSFSQMVRGWQLQAQNPPLLQGWDYAFYFAAVLAKLLGLHLGRPASPPPVLGAQGVLCCSWSDVMPGPGGQLEAVPSSLTPRGLGAGLQKKIQCYCSLKGRAALMLCRQEQLTGLQGSLGRDSTLCWLELWIVGIVFWVGTCPFNVLLQQRDRLFPHRVLRGPLSWPALRRFSETFTQDQMTSLWLHPNLGLLTPQDVFQFFYPIFHT